MKMTLVKLILSICMLWGTAFASAKSDTEKIKVLITEAYVEGLQNWGDLEKTKQGFDPTFNLLIAGKKGELKRYAIADWMKNVARKKKKNPGGPKEKTTVTFIDVDITGTVAVAKIELRKGGKHIFTDYLSLYKFESGWRIVSKVYFQHK